ncbi:hypothetical protein [Longibacter salinarum]|uniref:hypothetical protein n=1 Tax=Longibacter salinarum TaxID=1850348 RepID=UPI000BF0B8EA|nr:hypothetical protein [Longibacter salinarum]
MKEYSIDEEYRCGSWVRLDVGDIRTPETGDLEPDGVASSAREPVRTTWADRATGARGRTFEYVQFDGGAR